MNDDTGMVVMCH